MPVQSRERFAVVAEFDPGGGGLEVGSCGGPGLVPKVMAGCTP
jgi:hypothetical protein